MSEWAAVLNGVTGRINFSNIVYTDNTDIELTCWFPVVQTGGLLSDGLAGRYFRYAAGSFRFRSSSTTYSTWPFTPVAMQRYVLKVECRSGGVQLFIDGSPQALKSGTFGTFSINTAGMFNGNLFSNVVFERIKIDDFNTPANSVNVFNDVVAGSSTDFPDTSVNNKTFTLVGTPTDGSQWELIGGGSTSVTVNPVGQPQTIGQVTLTQKSTVTIGGLLQAQSVEEITLQQGGSLSLNNLQQFQSIEQVNLTQAHIVSVDGLLQGQSVEQVSLLAGGTLAVDGISQLQSSGGVNLTQKSSLAINDLNNAQTLDQVSLLVAGSLNIDGISNAQSLQQMVLSVIGSVNIDSLSNPQSLEQLIVTAFNGSTVQIASLDQQQSIDEITLSQMNVVSVDNLSQAQLLESINFNGVVVGYLQGALTIISAYNGKIKLTNPLTGEIRIL